MRTICRLTTLALCLLWITVQAAEVIPPKPTTRIIDEAHLLSPAATQFLNQKLEALEKSDSTQIIVAIFKKQLSDAPVEDYTRRVAEAWNIGQRKTDNGAVLFLFQEDRQLYIQVGYGLEGSLPDLLCKRIIENEIIPRFKSGDFEGGMVAGVEAMLAAVRGEYKATAHDPNAPNPWILFFFFAMLIFILGRMRGSLITGGRTYGGHSRGWGSGSSSGWGDSSGGLGGGGGGFSGGGGSFGGGGAGGRW